MGFRDDISENMDQEGSERMRGEWQRMRLRD